MFEQLNEWQSTIIVLLLVFILLNIWFERHRRAIKPEYTFTDKGAFVRLRFSPSYQVFTTQTTKIPKNKVFKISRNSDSLSLCYESGHTVDLWVSGQWLQDLFDEACFLFPEADIEEHQRRTPNQTLKPGSQIMVNS